MSPTLVNEEKYYGSIIVIRPGKSQNAGRASSEYASKENRNPARFKKGNESERVAVFDKRSYRGSRQDKHTYN